MSKSLVDQIIENLADRADYPIRTARMQMLRELELIAAHQIEMVKLLSYEGTYQEEIHLGLQLGPSRLVSAQRKPIAGESLFPSRISGHEVDPFNYLLINSAEINYFAAIRDHAKYPRAYGNVQTWIVWVTEFSGLVRYQVEGQLDALRQFSPDLTTAAILRDAGLDISQMKSPRAILRIHPTRS